MKYTIQGLLTLLIGLFIISACKNPDGVGLDIDPEDAIKGNLIDTLTISAFTVREDSLISNNDFLPQNPLGYFKDPKFGITQSNLALGYGDPVSGISFGTGSTLDSAVLILPLGTEFYGDTLNSTYKINVYQLAEGYTASEDYYNTKKWLIENSIIGSLTKTKFRLKDSIKIQDIIVGKPDGSKNVAPQIRIPINSAFINNYFLGSPSTNFQNAQSLRDAFKGMYVRFDENVGGAGGILALKPANAALQIYYKKSNGTTIDTSSVSFPLNSGTSEISHDYTGTEVATQLLNPNQQFPVVFLQPMSGLKVKVKFPYIKNLQSLGEVTVNKAELIVRSDATTLNPFPPLQRIYLYTDDIAGQKINIPDHSTTDSRALFDNLVGGVYQQSNQQYVFNITAYIQDIISGRLKQYNTFIVPAYESVSRLTDIQPNRAASTAQRSVVGGSLPGNYQMKLKIYYTLKD